MSLKKYKEKRNFNSTSEPNGKIEKEQNYRFVIQYHMARAKHYDFRLEHKGVLLSWAVPKGLSLNTKDKRLAVQVEDHPVDYVTFEGIIPKGNYGAGTVQIFDEGNYIPLEDFSKGLKKGHIKFVLNGNKLKGGWSLFRIKDNNWLIVKIEDEFATTEKQKQQKLIKTNYSVQLATLARTIPKGECWVYEIKYDGYRVLSFIENGKVKLTSRNKQDYTHNFKNLAKVLANIDGCAVLDGEVVVFDENGRTDFGLLQQAIKAKNREFYYIIFDALVLDNKDIRSLPLIERKAKLERVMNKLDKHLIYSAHFDDGEHGFEFARKNNLEGVIAKKKASLYSGKRNEDWLKIKCYLRQEFIIIGFTKTDRNKLISALLLGYYKNNNLEYVGKVGTGFSESDKLELYKKLKGKIRKTSPLSKDPIVENVTWLTPYYVCEIQYAELTNKQLLRQPSFIALREDKNPKDIRLENI